MGFSAIFQAAKNYEQKRKVNDEIKESMLKKRRFAPTINQRIKFIKKEDNYFNWSQSGNGKKSVRRTIPLTL